jgi:hypothetical protein
MTLDFLILLSKLYTEKSRHQKAVAIHEDILRTILDECQDSQGKTIDIGRAARIAAEHVELLRHALCRCSGKHNEPEYKSLFGELQRLFGKEKAWSDRAPAPLTHKPAKGTEKIGIWFAPADWGFNLEELTVQKKEAKPLIFKHHRAVPWSLYNGNSGAASPVSSQDIFVG